MCCKMCYIWKTADLPKIHGSDLFIHRLKYVWLVCTEGDSGNTNNAVDNDGDLYVWQVQNVANLITKGIKY